MRRHVIGLVSAAVGTLGIFLAACSSSNSGTGNASTSSAFADQYCTYIASCCGAESYPSDGKQCHTLLALETPSSGYDPQAGNACIAAVQAASQKDPAWCVDDVADTNKACDSVFGKNGGGSVQPGGACQSDSDCASPPAGDAVKCRDYFGSNGANTQICQVWVPGKPGDACIGTQTVTAGGVTETSYYDSDTGDGGTHPSQGVICYTSDGVTCELQNGAYACVALGQVGDSCQGTGSCVATAYCDFNSGEKCVARGQTGDSCTSSSSDSCVAGDYCDSGSSKCIAQLGSGAACTSSQQCQSNDCTNGKCGAGIGSLGLSFFCGSPSSSDAGK